MKRDVTVWCVVLVVVAALNSSARSIESKYHSAAEVDEFVTGLVQAHPELVRAESVATSIEGRNVWLLEVGRGDDVDRSVRPAMLVVAGLEGNHLVGTEMAMAFLDHLVQRYSNDETVRELLDSRTIYVFPRLNPDGAERYFMVPRAEQSKTLKPTDDDRDGMTDEDGPDDLDGDGVIGWVRIEDSEGEYVQDERDDRIMVKAKPEKGQRGTWRYFVEGMDNDADEKYNEDGKGGVNFNMNFPFGYKFFDPAAGLHQVSEPETRALADFVIAHQNIGLVFTFSLADNLTKSPEAGKQESSDGDGDGRRRQRKPVTSVNPKDMPYFKHVGKEYREVLGIPKELTGGKVPGSFADWIYFHRGRMSLAARGWSPEIQLSVEKGRKVKERKDEAAEQGGCGEETADENGERNRSAGEKKDEEDKELAAQREFLKWLDENYPEGFLDWTAIDHPDFPGQTAEVGGPAPYVRTNPPPCLLDELGAKHATFMTELAAKLPAISFRNIDVKHLGAGTFEIEVQVENNGYLPTVLAHGAVTKEVLPTRIEMDIEAEQILAGDRITRIGSIPGSGGVEKVRYIIQAGRRTPVTVRAVSALGGTIEQTMVLGR